MPSSRTARRALGAIALPAAVALAVTGCSSGGAAPGTGSAASKTLVVDNSFDLKTSDPARAFELTGSIVDKAIYETALTFEGSDVTKPVPQLTTFAESSDDKTLTLTLNGKHVFSNGDPVTIDDVVFSFKRVQAIDGNPAFLLQNPDGSDLAIAKTSDTTMTITSAVANPQLPFILPNPSLGVLDEKTLAAHGGTDTAKDAAESYLNGHSAGSGPYELESYGVNTKVVFAPNPHYVGTKPAYGRVVLQDVQQGSTQKINVQAGQAQVALDLNADQVAGLGTGSTEVVKGTSPDVIYLWLNQDPSVSKGVTDKGDFVTAVRRGIDYGRLTALAGGGARQPGGMVPSQFLGAIQPDATDSLDASAAKAALAKAGGSSMTLTYPSDKSINGLSFQTIAQAVQAQLKAVGVTVTLAPSPIATLLTDYRAGKLQAGLMYWGPDYPDPSDYLTFSPGEALGLRAGWAKSAAADVTTAKNAAIAASGDARAAAYEAWQRACNASGPFVPLLQPGQYIATTSAITTIQPNAVWAVDLAAVK